MAWSKARGLAVFAAAGRLVEYDDSGAFVTVNGEERLLEPATLVTGHVIQVPEHISEGEVVTVDTRTGEFLRRA